MGWIIAGAIWAGAFLLILSLGKAAGKYDREQEAIYQADQEKNRS